MIKGKGAGVRLQIENVSTSQQSKSFFKENFWSLIFGFTTFPFFFWGCPFYLLIGRRLSAGKSPHKPGTISSTKNWWKAIFDCTSVPLTSIISLVLLVPTVLINAYVAYVLGSLFNSLFIAGTYKVSSFYDILELIRYLPIVVPLDYVWFSGFRINNFVRMLNSLGRKYEGIGCNYSFPFRVFAMIIGVIFVHVIRYICYEKYEVAESHGWWNSTETILEFSLDIFSSFLLPLYCAFCYSVMFQLYLIKAYLYKLISQRVLPNIMHLSVVKTLFTQAADSILEINKMFSLYLSVALLIMIFGTVIDAQSMWKGLAKAVGSSQIPWLYVIALLAGEFADETPETGKPAEKLTPSDIREINAEIACILIMYGMIYFTIRQAIATNDCVRELNVWLNDFVTGGGGTDVVAVLQNLGVLQTESATNNFCGRGMAWNTNEDIEKFPLVWAKSCMMENGMDDEFLRKFRNLKAYIHARMQLEKPSLLSISLVGFLTPSMKGRLKNYNVIF